MENVDKKGSGENPKAGSNGSNAARNLTLDPHREFTVVGMGGSAGSLEAIEAFFSTIPADTGIAFVIVTHLDPNYHSVLPDLIQRCTRMPVVRIEDGMGVTPNRVYTLPENKELAILNGRLLLLEPSKPRGFRMPIDSFLQSLAEDWGEKSVCIIFSGMGSDGELGSRFIKEVAGLVIVQEPETAKYDSMPRSVIGAGEPDYVVAPKEMGRKLIDYVHYPLKHLDKKAGATDRKTANALQKIFVLLRTHTGHDFSLYKRATLLRRLERRIQILQLLDLNEYVSYIQQNPDEVHTLFKELLIGVTKFFRDTPAFAVLEDKVLPELLRRKGRNETFRVWIAGCSTGEEAYSVGILIRECIHKLKIKTNVKVQIYATDLDPAAIKRARSGLYLGNISNDISLERLERWFIKRDDYYQIVQEVREMVVFAEHNLLKDAPFTKLDLVCCRNVLIYLAPELQKKLLPIFHYTLTPGGVIFLGPSETISGFEDQFAAVDAKWRIFRRLDNNQAAGRIAEFPTHSRSYPTTTAGTALPERTAGKGSSTLAEKARKLLLEKHTPPSVLINERGSILFVNGQTGNYLQLAPGQADINVFDMARNGLASELRSAVLRANAEKHKVEVNNVLISIGDGHLALKLTVEPLDQPGEMQGLLLLKFEEQAPVRKTRKASGKAQSNTEKDQIIEDLERELRATRERLQHTLEQMQTSVEEMRSTNEELQSTNEELQSANEEANTAKEEMQALNEELMTVNMEFRAKAEELAEINNDMANLLNSSNIATIFLNNKLEIKRFTSHAIKIVNLIQSDLGRPITHISTNLKYDQMAHDAQEVLQQLVSREVQVESLHGQWFAMRINPYRTGDNFIGGVVITFFDITSHKQLEKSALRFAEKIVQTIRHPLLVLDWELVVIAASRSFTQMFGVPEHEVIGQVFHKLGDGQWDIPRLRELLEDVLLRNGEFTDYPVEHNFPGIGYKRMLVSSHQIVQPEVGKQMVILSIEEEKGNGDRRPEEGRRE